MTSRRLSGADKRNLGRVFGIVYGTLASVKEPEVVRITGKMMVADVNAAREAILRLLIVPGRWSVHDIRCSLYTRLTVCSKL